MNFLDDVYQTNKGIIPKALKLIIKNWTIIFAGLVYSVVLLFLWRIAFMFWILAGIVVTLVQSALVSNYLYLIENILRQGRITMNDFKDGFRVYTFKIYGVMIVIWFVNYGAGLFLSPILNISIGFLSLGLLIQGLAFIALNPLPEVIYQKHYGAGESFGYSFDFVKENWVEWFLPNVIIAVLIYLLLGRTVVANLIMGRMTTLFMGGIITFFVGQLFFSFVMIYRGLLFQVLSTSTRRKRMFMRNGYK